MLLLPIKLSMKSVRIFLVISKIINFLIKKSAKEPTDAVAETRAAQILAEMLGV